MDSEIVTQPKRKSRGRSAKQRARIANGQCVWCGNTRGSEGTQTYCRPCSDRLSEAHKQRRIQRTKNNRCIACKIEMSPQYTRLRCPVCLKKDKRAYKQPSAQARKASHIKHKYKLSIEWFQNLIKEQENKCAICRIDFDGTRTAARPCIDHDHTSGKVRGLLCHRCNTGLGMFKDERELLFAAADYLNQQPVNWDGI